MLKEKKDLAETPFRSSDAPRGQTEIPWLSGAQTWGPWRCCRLERDVKTKERGRVAARGRSRVKQRASALQLVKGRGRRKLIGGRAGGGRWSDLGSRGAAGSLGGWGAHPPSSSFPRGWQALAFPRCPSSRPLPNLITPTSCPLVISLAAS